MAHRRALCSVFKRLLHPISGPARLSQRTFADLAEDVCFEVRSGVAGFEPSPSVIQTRRYPQRYFAALMN